MSSVHLVPGEARVHLLEPGFDQVSAFEWNVRILPSPDMKQLRLNLARPVERVIVHAFAETPLVNIGGIEAGRCQNIRIHRSSKCQVTSDADTHHAETPVASVERFQIVERGSRIAIVRGDLLADLTGISTIGACLVVSEHRAGGLEFVVNLGRRYHVTMSSQHRRGAAYWSCD